MVKIIVCIQWKDVGPDPIGEKTDITNVSYYYNCASRTQMLARSDILSTSTLDIEKLMNIIFLNALACLQY